MKRIPLRLADRSYSILVGRNLLSSIGRLLKPLRLGSKVLVVSNRRVAKLFLAGVRSSLKRAGYEVPSPFLLPHGNERDKSEKVLIRLWSHMARTGLERTSTVLALGGGVVGDVAAFAASTYLRGISLVQVPTTLLAQVDAAIGGKTAIDLPSAKNIVGTFYQPRMVIADVKTLARLASLRELRNGFAEVIKYGVIQEAALFRLLEQRDDWSSPGFLERVVWRSARVKASVVEKDERETKGLRMILNYGHTFAHALEAASNYRLPHGEAVGIGMACAARLAVRRGMFRLADEFRQNRLIRRAGLATTLRGRNLKLRRVIDSMLLDKKKKEGRLRFVLPQRIGRVRVVENVSLGEVRRVLKELGGK